MSGVPAHILTAAGTDPDALAAVEFVLRFAPKPGVDYEWVVTEARTDLGAAREVFATLDAKAGALIGYVGAGVGFGAFGAAAAASSAAVHPVVVALTCPTILFAAAAVILAARCRATEPVHRLPPPVRLAEWAEVHDTADRARAYLIPQLQLCAALLRPVLRRKSELVENATRCFAAAVAALLLPLAATVAVRVFGP